MKFVNFNSKRNFLQLNYDFKKGTTSVLDTKSFKIDISEEVIPIAMEIA